MRTIHLAALVCLLPACAGRFATVQPAAFPSHARLSIVAFDSFDWTHGLLAASEPATIRDALGAAFDAFTQDLTQARFDVRATPVAARCSGDLGDLCGFIPVAGLSPVNLSAAQARASGESAGADLVVEVHVLPDVHVDGFWSFTTYQDGSQYNPHQPNRTLLVRAFDAKGNHVWEDQELLALPITFSRDSAIRNLKAALPVAARNVVRRLVERTQQARGASERGGAGAGS